MSHPSHSRDAIDRPDRARRRGDPGGSAPPCGGAPPCLGGWLAGGLLGVALLCAHPALAAPPSRAQRRVAPQAKDPVAKAPDAKAPHTKAPHTKAPNTEAPNTEAPATKTKPRRLQAYVVATGSWVWWIGWSLKSDRFAWRVGRWGTGNVIGSPMWVATWPKGAQLRADTLVTENTGDFARQHKIARRGVVVQERVTPEDILVLTTRGHMYAVAVRPKQQTLALLRRYGDTYRVLLTQPFLTQSTPVTVTGFESPDLSRLALVVHTGAEVQRRAYLMVVQHDNNVNGYVAKMRPDGKGRAADRTVLPARVLRHLGPLSPRARLVSKLPCAFGPKE